MTDTVVRQAPTLSGNQYKQLLRLKALPFKSNILCLTVYL